MEVVREEARMEETGGTAGKAGASDVRHEGVEGFDGGLELEREMVSEMEKSVSKWRSHFKNGKVI